METNQHQGYIMEKHGLHVDLYKIKSIHDWSTLHLQKMSTFRGPHQNLSQAHVGVLAYHLDPNPSSQGNAITNLIFPRSQQ